MKTRRYFFPRMLALCLALAQVPLSLAQDTTVTSAEQEVWTQAVRSGQKDDLQIYLQRYPKGFYAEAAKERINAIFKLEAEQRDARVFRDCPHCPEMVEIPAGTFVMGSNDFDNVERPPHPVKVPTFSIGRTEITQAQWRAMMGRNPAQFNGCDECPVEMVSWQDAHEYINQLRAETGRRYRLPSEAEWEYACRAGANSAFCGGNSFLGVAWTDQNAGGRTRPVGQRRPNAFGLYDMSGNVWEWVQDCFNASYFGAPSDGKAWTSGECAQRIVRGGSWDNPPELARSAKRNWEESLGRYYNFGFRVALPGGRND